MRWPESAVDCEASLGLDLLVRARAMIDISGSQVDLTNHAGEATTVRLEYPEESDAFEKVACRGGRRRWRFVENSAFGRFEISRRTGGQYDSSTTLERVALSFCPRPFIIFLAEILLNEWLWGVAPCPKMHQKCCTKNRVARKLCPDVCRTTDSITNFPVTGATSGIGLLRRTTTGVLKAEITALEAIGLGKTISNPKIFTLDNQTATITQGEEIP